ncbi:MAG: stage II sporulation protein M [Archangium sp.]
MAEALAGFVARRRPDWTALEALLARQKTGSLTLADVSELDRLYRRASADLAAAQLAYANTDVHRFLNQLTATAWRSIYVPRPSRLSDLREFYARTFPSLVREALPLIQVSAALMALGVLLGAITVWLHPEGTQLLVLPEIRGWLARREMWTDGVLGVETPQQLALGIFVNNLRVTLIAFLLGISAGLGTVFVVFQNGMLIGAIVAASARVGLGWNIVTFMSAHGPIELSLICITAGAGLGMGRALIAPGERSRRVALAEAAQKGVRILFGAAPFMVAIGIVEGFVSPGAYFPSALKFALGGATFFAFWRWLLRSGR